MMTDTIAPGSTLSLVAGSAADKARAFRAAARHTARVRLARRLVFGSGVALVAGLVAFPFINPFRAVAIKGVTVESIGLDGTKVTMAKPKLAGYRNDGRPYEITASSAVQDIKEPTRFALNDMDARLTMQDNALTHVTAKSGLYDNKLDTMDLTSQVVISSDSGFALHALNAHVEFRTGSVSTPDPVSVAMRGNTITADGMRMIDNGRQVTFEGHVKTTFIPGEGGQPATPAPQPDATAPQPATPAPQPAKPASEAAAP